MSDEQGLPKRALPPYNEFGEFVMQEVPYLLEDNTNGDNVQVVNIRFDDRFPNTITLTVNGQVMQVEGVIDRLGVFKDNARRLTPSTFTAQSNIEDDVIQGDENLKRETFNLVDAVDGKPVLDPIDNLPHQITKVIRIPYRWRRPVEGATTRQTYLLICYTGPSNH